MKRVMINKHRGFTLTELLVVVVIIGLLASIAIPVYISRMENARINVARAEARELAHGEEQCAIIHGYYVPLQVLDDIPNPVGFSSGSTSADRIDLEPDSLYLVNPLIRPDVQNSATPGQDTFGSNKPRVVQLVDEWQGPFMTFQRWYVPPGIDPKSTTYPQSAQARLDFPIDPWGEPYRFYSPIGAIGSAATQSAPSNGYTDSVSDGDITTLDDRDLERFAIVSYGRDNIPDDGTTSQDDIIYLFGTGGLESDFGLRL